jgi:hypothetical protein
MFTLPLLIFLGYWYSAGGSEDLYSFTVVSTVNVYAEDDVVDDEANSFPPFYDENAQVKILRVLTVMHGTVN